MKREPRWDVSKVAVRQIPIRLSLPFPECLSISKKTQNGECQIYVVFVFMWYAKCQRFINQEIFFPFSFLFKESMLVPTICGNELKISKLKPAWKQAASKQTADPVKTIVEMKLQLPN